MVNLKWLKANYVNKRGNMKIFNHMEHWSMHYGMEITK